MLLLVTGRCEPPAIRGLRQLRFGEHAARALCEELARAGVDLVTGVVAHGGAGGLVLEPTGVGLDVQRVFAVPRIVGPALDGLACDEEGFILTREDGRVRGARHTWAAGDGPAGSPSTAWRRARARRWRAGALPCSGRCGRYGLPSISICSISAASTGPAMRRSVGAC